MQQNLSENQNLIQQHQVVANCQKKNTKLGSLTECPLIAECARFATWRVYDDKNATKFIKNQIQQHQPGSLTNCPLITERARFTRWRVYDDWRRQRHCGGDQMI